MDPQFWIDAWNEGKTNFHQEEYHAKLMEYFPELNPKAGQCVLVPLCGKSKDLLWLHGLGLNVHGIEIYDQVVEDFFTENKLSPLKKTQDQIFKHYTHNNLVISCGDFFKLSANQSYDFIYDRASLVALPAEMRKNYSEVIKRSLKIGGKYLLIAYEYDQAKLDGPPFSVAADEVHELYRDQFKIKLMESKQSIRKGARPSTLDYLIQTVYILEKIL